MDIGDCLAVSASTRGIAATIGANNQFFSLIPTFDANNTNIVLAATCENAATNYSCVAEYGGVYTPTNSAYQTNNMASWNGTPGYDVETNSAANQKLLFFNDLMKIGNNDLWGLPFYSGEFLSDGYVWPSGIGLGSKSSLVQALLNTSAIPTSLWSIWPGNRYQNLDGLLILGGYDQNRTTDDFTPINLDTDTITGLVWQHSDNTTTNLMPKGTKELSFTFEPANDFLILPAESSSTFRKTLDGVSMNDGSVDDVAYSAMPTGNLIVTLSNGNQTLIPATDLFQNPQYYDDQGRLTVSTASIFTDKISSNTDNSSTGVWLGEPFLTHHVLVVDSANNAYYLADAVQTELGSGASNIQYLCYDNSAELARAHKKKIAGIAVGVVGGVVALALVALLAMLYLRQRQGKRVARGIPEIVLRMRSKKKGSSPEKLQPLYDSTDDMGYMHKSPESLQPVHNLPEVTHSTAKSPRVVHTPHDPPEVTSLLARPEESATAPSDKIAVDEIHETHADVRHEMLGDIKTKTNSGPFELPSDGREQK